MSNNNFTPIDKVVVPNLANTLPKGVIGVINPHGYNSAIKEIDNNIKKEHLKTLRIIEERNIEKAKKEQQSLDYQRISAENTTEIKENLEVVVMQQKEDLENQRILIKVLKEKLNGIDRTLDCLFNVQENSLELQEEANKIFEQMQSSMSNGNKTNWKEFAADKGFDAFLLAIQMILHKNNLL